MTQYKKSCQLFLWMVLMASCTKYEALQYTVDKPESVLVQEDIDSYPELKSYINAAAHPHFNWGMALSLSEYVNKGVMYRLANRNFNQIVLGYEMKHGAVVQADGSLSLDKVSELLATAKTAGMNVYGHTLCWHANQNATYLNKLIAPTIVKGTSMPTWDPISQNDFESSDNSNYQVAPEGISSITAPGGGADGTGKALKIVNSAVRTNDWEVQFFFLLPEAVEEGDQLELSMDVRSDANATFSTQAHTAPGAYKHWDFFGGISSTPQWTAFKKTITVSADQATSTTIAFNLGKTATSYYFDNIVVKKYNEEGSGSAGYALTFANPSLTSFWSAQTAYDVAGIQNETEYTLKFAAKGSVAGSIRAELQSTSNYSSNGFGTFALTQGWKEYELKTTATAADRNRFVISFGDYMGSVYMDNIVLTAANSSTNIIDNGDFEGGTIDGWFGWGNSSTRSVTAEGEGFGGAGDQIIEKTAFQKDSILSATLENWIKGILELSKDQVKSWDVVNEPMDDGDPYALKTGIGRTNIATDEFFWQDYLGKDYAIKAIRYARMYGNANDTLFINDYNLEYNLDKCKGLIAYVKYIESKGVKVDGIGTQMHISINTNKENIAEHFRLLAATGKLIKISELDIGLGNNTKTADATPAQYEAQAEMYQYVIEKYFEMIPAAQRYGITIWSPKDSPVNSSWRAGEPIGLWTETYVRKPAYKSVAASLAAKAGR